MRGYRLAMTLALPVLALGQVWAAFRGRARGSSLAERLALPLPGVIPSRPGGMAARLWLHGASLGELTSARWLMVRLLGARPGLRLVITCNTETARAMVQGWSLPDCDAVLAPFDTRGAVARFLAHWRPAALITLENELWPERIAQATAAGVPVLWIGARLSPGSARNWHRFARRLIRATLARVSLVSAQDAGSEARLLALGLDAARLGPRFMLKAKAGRDAPPAPPFALTHPRAAVLLAGSTHEGEEGPLLDAFAAQDRFGLLILAPRHPQRGAEVAALVRARGLTLAIRSAGEVPDPQTRVYLADTLGEMGHWYAMAGATMIGATLVDRGGHTPFEPAAHGSAILHGPSVANFAETFAALDAAGAALRVEDGADLARVLRDLDEGEQTRLATAAAHLLLSPDPAEAGFLRALEGQLDAALNRA